MGEPTRSGEAKTIHGLGRMGPWDRYDRPAVCIHVRYTEGGERVEMITLMAPDAAP